MTKGGGSGKTPKKIVELLSKAVAEKGQSAVARESGLTQSAVHRYLSGIGEPSSSTLSKLAEYFKVNVSVLRGDFDYKAFRAEMKERMDAELAEHYKKYGLIAQEFLNQVPRDAEEISNALKVIEDAVDKLLLELIKEDLQCQDQSKK